MKNLTHLHVIKVRNLLTLNNSKIEINIIIQKQNVLLNFLGTKSNL